MRFLLNDLLSHRVTNSMEGGDGNMYHQAGASVGAAGDVNRDGFDDIFVTVPGPTFPASAQLYVVYGR